MDPKSFFPPLPLAFPQESDEAAAKKAISMWTSPVSTARGRPP